MEKNAVNWFEIPVKDMARARKFYSELLRIDMQDMNMPDSEMVAFPWVQGGESSAGALVKADGYEPSQSGVVIYFACDDIQNELSRVEALGGKITVPRMSIGEHGFIAHIVDTEGNRVALHSTK